MIYISHRRKNMQDPTIFDLRGPPSSAWILGDLRRYIKIAIAIQAKAEKIVTENARLLGGT